MTQYQQVSNSVDSVTAVSWKVCNECGITFLQASERYNEPNVTEAKRNEVTKHHQSCFCYFVLKRSVQVSETLHKNLFKTTSTP